MRVLLAYFEEKIHGVDQQTQDVESMLINHWSSVVDGGPTVNQHYIDSTSCVCWEVKNDLTLYRLCFVIKIYTHLKLCVAAATHNFQAGENYPHLFNLRPNIYQFSCLNTHFIPIS